MTIEEMFFALDEIPEDLRSLHVCHICHAVVLNRLASDAVPTTEFPYSPDCRLCGDTGYVEGCEHFPFNMGSHIVDCGTRKLWACTHVRGIV